MSDQVKRTRGLTAPLQGNETAKRHAAAILEVLAGLRSPTDASQALGISAMRYYVLERRAMEGMVQALQPRPKGKRKGPEGTLNELRREKIRLEREVGRLQALVRAAQRTMKLPPLASQEKKKEGGRRARRPQVRAEKTIALLRAPVPEPAPTP
jgi:hypothetical protein